MAETETAPPETVEKPATADGKPADDPRVPYERFEQVNTRARDLERELADRDKRLQELEDRDKSEMEKLVARAEKAETKAQELEGLSVRLERGSWVRSAAAQAGFTDPEDAVAFCDLSSLENASAAEKAVKDIAKRKPHLVRAEEPPRPEIGRVGADGRTAQPGQPEPDPESAKFLDDLKAAAGDSWTSAPGLLEK